jgi:hypothetical protein
MLPTIYENEQPDMTSIEYGLNQEFLLTYTRIKIMHDIFESFYANKLNNATFMEHELLEEKIDNFIYSYQKTKQLLKQGRLVRYHKEEKEKEKLNELRYARNTLAHYGIDDVTHK